MNELAEKELQLLKLSIKAIKQSISELINLDLENSIEMYNTALSAFETLQENHDGEIIEDSFIKRKLVELEEDHKNIIQLFEDGMVDEIPLNLENIILYKYEQFIKDYKKIIKLKGQNIDEKEVYYKKFKKASLLENIDENVLGTVQSYWDKYYKKRTYPILHLAYYNQTGVIEPRLIPQEVLNLDILPVLNELNFNGFYSDKNIYDLLIDEDSCPEVVLKRVNGQYFDKNNVCVSKTKAFRILLSMKEDLIVKNSTSDDGKSVEKIIYSNNNFYLDNAKIDLITIEKHWGKNILIQRVLKQHSLMAGPHKHSINTFRMVTLRWNNKINYLMTYARFGANGEVKDNGGEGGIVVGVSPDGKFSDFGMGDDARIYKEHPTTKFKFADLNDVPNFDTYINFVKKLHRRILHHNYVSWDIAMGVDGEPIFIEMNFRGPVWKYQMVTERPIFGEFTEEILIKATKERKAREKIIEEQKIKNEQLEQEKREKENIE